MRRAKPEAMGFTRTRAPPRRSWVWIWFLESSRSRALSSIKTCSDFFPLFSVIPNGYHWKTVEKDGRNSENRMPLGVVLQHSICWNIHEWFNLWSNKNFILTSTVTRCFFLFNFVMLPRSQSSISEFSQIWLLTKYGRKEFFNIHIYFWLCTWTLYKNLAKNLEFTEMFFNFLNFFSRNHWICNKKIQEFCNNVKLCTQKITATVVV